MKKIKMAVVGCGDRGNVYASYALQYPQEAEVVAVVDINPVALNVTGDKFQIPKQFRFSSLEAFLSAKIECDTVINATMDPAHYDTATKLIEAGYNQLLEKPVVNNQEDLLKIRNTANEKGVSVLVCHVLRYAPFYLEIKKLLVEGKIGKVQTLEMNEHVENVHFASSFLRGKWSDEDECGSGLLLQKCCHDTDLMCWLNNASAPAYVSSFGSRSQFTPDNAPEGATEFCAQCPHNKTCLYDAKRIQLDSEWLAFQTWRDIPKPLDEITYEEKLAHLASSDFGRCVYKLKKNLVDRQVVSVSFENGSVGTLTVVGGCSTGDRNIHIVGSRGTLKGSLSEGKFVLKERIHAGERYDLVETVIDLSKQIEGLNHGGGDTCLMRDYIRFLNGERNSLSITDINDSVYGHLCVYAAERSRRSKTIEKIEVLR